MSRPPYTILLLGESRSGKSMWINAFVNYLCYGSLDEAIRGEAIIATPTRFTIADENGDLHKLVAEPHVNTEESSEQNGINFTTSNFPISYQVFSHGRPIYRIIDTPSLADQKGIEQDKINIENILSFLTTIDDIHAICVVMKANPHKRINVDLALRRSLYDFFSSVRRSANANVVFFVTKARSINFNPQEVMTSLQTILDELRRTTGLELNCSKRSLFCFDNEPFCLLCAQREGVHFGRSQLDEFTSSWHLSIGEMNRFIEYAKSLRPIKQPSSLYQALISIANLQQPIAEMTNQILTNKVALKSKLYELRGRTYRTKKDLTDNLGVQFERFSVSVHPSPKLVCTSPNCRGRRPCLEQFYRNNFWPITADDLRYCSVMDPANGRCKICNCTWKHHDGLFYAYYREMHNVNEALIEQLDNGKRMKKGEEEAVITMEWLVENLSNQERVLLHTMVQFTAFSIGNALTLHPDHFFDSLNRKLNHLKSSYYNRGALADILGAHLKLYVDEVAMLERGHHRIGIETIRHLTDRLFSLEICGEQLQIIAHLHQQIAFATTVRNEKIVDVTARRKSAASDDEHSFSSYQKKFWKDESKYERVVAIPRSIASINSDDDLVRRLELVEDHLDSMHRSISLIGSANPSPLLRKITSLEMISSIRRRDDETQTEALIDDVYFYEAQLRKPGKRHVKTQTLIASRHDKGCQTLSSDIESFSGRREVRDSRDNHEAKQKIDDSQVVLELNYNSSEINLKEFFLY